MEVSIHSDANVGMKLAEKDAENVASQLVYLSPRPT